MWNIDTLDCDIPSAYVHVTTEDDLSDETSSWK